MIRTPVAIAAMTFMSSPPVLVDDLAFADAPDVGCTDIAIVLSDLDAAPAIAAFADAADDSMLDVILHPGALIRAYADRARFARFYDGSASVAEKRYQHPALSAVRI